MPPVTVTVQVANLLLSPSAVAVIVAVPALTAVTVPSGATVATEVSEDVQVTFLFVASLGSTVAVSFSLFPTEIEVLVLFSATPLTGTISGVSPPSPLTFRHRRARSRFRLRGHADGAAQTARADGDGLSAGQIDVVRHALYCVVGDLGRARNIEDTALVIPHGSLHIYTAALVAGRVVADLTAVHVDGSAVIHAAAKSSAVAGDLAAVQIECTELANAYASVGVAGDGAAKHIQRAEAEYIYAAVAAAFDRTAAYAVGQS